MSQQNPLYRTPGVSGGNNGYRQLSRQPNLAQSPTRSLVASISPISQAPPTNNTPYDPRLLPHPNSQIISQNQYQPYLPQYPPQQVNYNPNHGIPSPNATSIVHNPQSNTPPTPAAGKKSRLQRACDQCSERKVKCDPHHPCKQCEALHIPCTNSRESKRRGPPNKLAEAHHKSKKQRAEDPSFPTYQSPSIHSPSHQRESAEALALMSSQVYQPFSPQSQSTRNGHMASSSSHNGYARSDHPAGSLSGDTYGYNSGGQSIDELLCPKLVLDLLVDDFFTYIHAIAPFPHEPTFRNAYENQEYKHDQRFLALLASMIGVLVASFPRKPQQHLKANGFSKSFPTSLDFISRCHQTAVQARGTDYVDSLTIYDGVTSYFLGLAAAYTFNWKRTRIYLSETLSITRALGAHRGNQQGPPDYVVSQAVENGIQLESPEPVDFIQQQMGRRLFWVMIASIRSMQQLGAEFGDLLIPPPTPTNQYPPMPAEIDDEYFDSNNMSEQPAGIVSQLTGFNINVRIYHAMAELARIELCHGVDQVFDWPKQKRILNDCYETVERILERIPAELILKPGSKIGEFAPSESRQPSPADFAGQHLNGGSYSAQSMSRRLVQFEIQKANIYGSQLGTRSYIVEKFWNLQDAVNRIGIANLASPGFSSISGSSFPHAQGPRVKALEDRIAQERESIVNDLMKVLTSISKFNMEPNGGSFVQKVRQIASTLIDTNDTRKGPFAQNAQEFLSQLLNILGALERSGPIDDVTNGTIENRRSDPPTEEEELSIWANLREVQIAFFKRGGFLAES